VKAIFQISIIFHIVLYLSACGTIRLESFKMIQEVEITKVSCTNITVQSSEPSCGIADSDPPDLVCQKRSPVIGKSNKVSWSSQTGAFKLEFPSGNPFKENGGKCDLDTANTSFECKLKRRPARYIYKYNIVFTETCKKDPLFHIMH